jgi:hypothetical protein
LRKYNLDPEVQTEVKVPTLYKCHLANLKENANLLKKCTENKDETGEIVTKDEINEVQFFFLYQWLLHKKKSFPYIKVLFNSIYIFYFNFRS